MDFDSLSNDEIRLRLAQFGFPSVPVTQTTRKVLVKKLKLATENQKQKTRRETIAVTKFSSDEDVEPEKDAKKREKTPNRRITLAPGEKVTKPAVSSTNGDILLPPPASTARNTRRSSSGRSTPAEKQPTVSSTAPPSIQEDTDEEIREVLKTAPKRFSKSKSKTPTLTKSDTVRISYKTSAEKIQEQEENDDIIILDDVEGKNGVHDKNYISNSYQPQGPSSRQSKATYSSTDIRRKTLTSSINPGTSIPSASKTIRYSSALDSKYDRPSFTTSYNTYSTAISGSPALNTSASRYRSNTQKDYTYNRDEEEEEDEDDEDITGNAPYLSNFAKRLSTLKADPIVDVGMEKYKKLREVEQPTYQSSAMRYKRAALPAKQQKQTVVGSFIQVLEALDRKYHIRKILYFMFIIFVFVTIYVIFFKN